MKHIPVMLEQVTAGVVCNSDGHYIDGTFGGGGHSRYLLEHFPNIKLTAIDRDPDAISRAEKLKIEFSGRFEFLNMPFSQIDVLKDKKFDGIFFDFGISSLQLDDEERGFSFRFHSSLDMRMNPNEGISAYEFLQTANWEQLVEAVRDFGEERHWKKIISLILQHRGSESLKYSDTFAELISRNVAKTGRIHPATKTFQGLRIAINRELDEIRQVLPKAFQLLTHGGRLAAISFHSLEDRIVKQFFNQCAGKSDQMSTERRPACAKILTKKPMIPDLDEIQNNPRSRSAKLRILEKI